MADHSSAPCRRESIKSSSIGNVAAYRRRQFATNIGKERRELLIHTKRFCRTGISDDNNLSVDDDMVIDEEQSILDTQTSLAVEELKSAASYHGKGCVQKRVSALQELRRLLSRSEFPPVDVAIKAGAVPLLVQFLSFGSPDEQLHEAAWCLTNIAAGQPDETKALLPALPLLISHLGERSSLPVAEQCAWAIGNVAGEGEELRNVLLSQGALPPLARMFLSNKGSAVRTAAWTLSNLIKGPNPKAAMELTRISGISDAILHHLKKEDEELATEVAWVAAYLSAFSDTACNMMLKSGLIQVLVNKLSTATCLQLRIPVLRCFGNLIVGDSQKTCAFLVPGHDLTEKSVTVLTECLNSEHRVLNKEAAWVLSNIAAGSVEHKKLVYYSPAVDSLLRLLSSSPFLIRKEAAYALGNLCVAPSEAFAGRQSLILQHLVSLVHRGCLPGFINLVRTADAEAVRLGMQFMELVMRGMPKGEGPKLVEEEEGIEAMERFQFHENEDLRTMANGLVDKYFGADYGLSF